MGPVVAAAAVAALAGCGVELHLVDSEGDTATVNCQASRTAQIPRFNLGRGILKMAALFGAVPPMPSMLGKIK